MFIESNCQTMFASLVLMKCIVARHADSTVASFDQEIYQPMVVTIVGYGIRHKIILKIAKQNI